MMKNRLDADDVTQETLIRLWRNIDKLKIYKAKSWVIKTTHNLCIDYLRKHSVNNKRSEFIDSFTDYEIKDNSNQQNPFYTTHLNMLKDTLKKSIKNLPENLRSVLVLYEIEGFKYKEISNILEMPLNSVKVNLLRARKKLQEELKKYAEEDAI